MFLPQGIQGGPGVLHLRQLVLQTLIMQPAVVVLLDVLEQLRVHRRNVQEQRLHAAVVGY